MLLHVLGIDSHRHFQNIIFDALNTTLSYINILIIFWKKNVWIGNCMSQVLPVMRCHLSNGKHQDYTKAILQR